MAPMLNAACTGSSSYDVPGTRAPPVIVAPGTTGPSSFVHAGILERLEAAGERIHQAVERGLVRDLAVDLVVARVVARYRPAPGRGRAAGPISVRVVLQNASPGTRTQPSMSTRALRLMTALVTIHSPFTWLAAAPTRSVPDG